MKLYSQTIAVLTMPLGGLMAAGILATSDRGWLLFVATAFVVVLAAGLVVAFREERTKKPRPRD